MNSENITNGLKRFANQARDALKKPRNTILALSTVATILGSINLQAQNNDDLYATGAILATYYPSAFTIQNVKITAKSTIEPDKEYKFKTNIGGFCLYNNPGLPVQISTEINEQDNNNEITVLPNIGPKFNVTIPNEEQGVINLYDLSGKQVLTKNINSNNEQIDVSHLRNAMYVYAIQTKSGEQLTGKYKKQDFIPEGFTATKPSHKNSKSPTAEYTLVWEHPDFYKDSMVVTLHEGPNNPIIMELTPIDNSPVQHQDLVGTAKSSALEGYFPLKNMTAILYFPNTNQTIETTTNEEGTFIFKDIPTYTNCEISIGGDDSRVAFNNIRYNVPKIWDDNDTIAHIFNTVHERKSLLFTVDELKKHTENGSINQEKTYFYDNSVSLDDKQVYENWFNRLEEISNDYTYKEVFNLEEANIQITDGNYNIEKEFSEINNPLEKLRPVTNSIITLNTEGHLGDFAKLIYQANGKELTNDDGVLGPNPPATGPTEKDRAIATVDMNYWVNAVYTDQETFIDLNKADEFLESKSPKYEGMIFKDNQWQEKEVVIPYKNK